LVAFYANATVTISRQLGKSITGFVLKPHNGVLRNMSKKIVPPGGKVPDSGIYRDTSSGERSTLVRGKTAPPTQYRGGKWIEIIDTNPRDPSSRR
jgi:hypothetical protein